MQVMYIMRSQMWKSKGEDWYFGNFSDSDICIPSKLEKIKGPFACICSTDIYLTLAVDIISSMPLFYSIDSDIIYISDDAAAIAEKIGASLNEKNILEFLKASYVTETETVFNNIYTLSPASYVQIDRRSGAVQKRQYFELDYDQSDNSDDNELLRKFDCCLEEVFKDLINRLDGRTAVIPLSGGCDSRIVAAFLKRLDYKNVVCFSYGRKNNWEANRSREVAEHLGFPWYFTEYTADVWRDFYSSATYKEFLRYSCRGRSIGCAQAFPAVQELTEKGLIPKDAVVIPGHALDFTLGSHLTPKQIVWGKDETIQHILDEHYYLRESQKENGNIEKWIKHIPVSGDGCAYANAYMQWEWRNRQSKFIANDVRTYEFFGYNYELPFWDIRVQRFAMGLPFSKLYGRQFQYLYMKKIIDPVCGLQLHYESEITEKKKIKEYIKKFPLIKAYLKRRDLHIRRFSDSNAFYSWLSDEQYQMYASKLGESFNINSIVADDYVQYILEIKRN